MSVLNQEGYLTWPLQAIILNKIYFTGCLCGWSFLQVGIRPCTHRKSIIASTFSKCWLVRSYFYHPKDLTEPRKHVHQLGLVCMLLVHVFTWFCRGASGNRNMNPRYILYIYIPLYHRLENLTFLPAKISGSTAWTTG